MTKEKSFITLTPDGSKSPHSAQQHFHVFSTFKRFSMILIDYLENLEDGVGVGVGVERQPDGPGNPY